MNAANLWPEIHAAARALRPAHLMQLGITVDDALAAGGLGAAKITPIGGGLYEPDGILPAILLPVFWAFLPKPGAPVPDHELIDLLAFDPAQPDRFWLRRGDGIFLNAGALDDLWLGAPLRLYRDPLSWLRAAADGGVALDWRMAAPRLRTVATIDAEDADHARDIRWRLQQNYDLPDIRYPARLDGRAA